VRDVVRCYVLDILWFIQIFLGLVLRVIYVLDVYGFPANFRV
jgi:hypothetical protein